MWGKTKRYSIIIIANLFHMLINQSIIHAVKGMLMLFGLYAQVIVTYSWPPWKHFARRVKNSRVGNRTRPITVKTPDLKHYTTWDIQKLWMFFPLCLK